MTDPMDALMSFQPAFRAKMLDVHRGELDPAVFVHLDRPNGEPRYTYARTRGGKVLALAILIGAEPIERLPCFAIGYAVAEDERGHGLARSLAEAAIAELRHGLARHGVTTLWVEAVVDRENIASQKVAAAVLTDAPREGTDSVSGRPVFVYARKYGEG